MHMKMSLAYFIFDGWLILINKRGAARLRRRDGAFMCLREGILHK